MGLRRGRLAVNWQGQSGLAREAGPALWRWGQEQTPRGLSCPWDAIVRVWIGLVTLLAWQRFMAYLQWEECSEIKINYKHESKL